MNEYEWICVIGIAIILLLFLIFRVQKRGDAIIRANISCNEGNYTVKGSRHRFQIKKGNRYIFEVENGCIVAAKERHGLHYKKILY